MGARLLLSFLHCAHVLAWWDQGHMLVAAVAELALTSPDQIPYTQVPWTSEEGQRTVEVINRVLSAWNADYPAFSNLVSAAVWADHIKCRQRSPFCWDRHFDGIEIFNPSHFLNLVVDDTSPVALSKIKSSQYRPGNAFWLLSEICKSLSSVMRYSAEKDPFRIARLTRAAMRALINNTAHEQPDMPNRHETGTLQDGDVLHGTRFSYNLLIRLFIHILGDIHQPLHTVSRSSPCTPEGDRGGNAVAVRLSQPSPNLPATTNLHQLWDSAGGALAANYPEFDVHQARLQAQRLVLSHSAVDALNGTLEDMFVAASDIAWRDVYSELRASNKSCGAPYEPSRSYMRKLEEVTHRQITTAGYHLAAFLAVFARDIPKHAYTRVASESELLEVKVAVWKVIATATSSGLAVASLFIGYLSIKLRLMRRSRLDKTLTPPLQIPLLSHGCPNFS